MDPLDIALTIPADGDHLRLAEQYRRPVADRRRYLREETGSMSGSLTALGTHEILPRTYRQRSDVFLAVDLAQGATQRDPTEQDMRAEWFTRSELEQMGP